MSPESAALIARIQAMPKKFEVVTLFADGKKRSHQTATFGQAESYAVGERRKIGKSLINRETGETVNVIDVYVSTL